MFDIGKFIEYLKKNDLPKASQTAVGKAIHKDQSYVSQIIKGVRPFLDEYIELIRQAYGNDVVDNFLQSNNIDAEEMNSSDEKQNERKDLSNFVTDIIAVMNKIADAALNNSKANIIMADAALNDSKANIIKAEAELNDSKANITRADAEKINSKNMEELILMLKNEKIENYNRQKVFL